MSLTIAQKREKFVELHRTGCFVIPNPHDVGAAKALRGLGFKALATTSAGMALAMGLPDGGVPRGAVLKHIGEIAAATDLPVNADFENCFGVDPDGVFESARLCVGAGVSGFSIEDSTGDRSTPLFASSEAVARVRAARAAIDASGQKVLLTARSEAVLLGLPDGFAEAMKRMALYAEAGADVLYVPVIKTEAQVRELVRLAGPLPVNVLVGAPGFTVKQLEDLGVRRVSVGGALARAAWGGFLRAAREIAEHGRFDAFADAAPYADIVRVIADTE